MNDLISGVYKITCLVNNKVYIGSSVNITKRWHCHKSTLNKNRHHSKYLQNSWNKYGVDHFEFKVLIYCDPHNNLYYEQKFIDHFDASNKNFGFNMSPLVSSPTSGKSYKEKISKLRGSYKRYMWKGELRTLLGISEIEGFDYSTLSARVMRGVPLEEALARDKRVAKYSLDYKGQSITLKEAAEVTGIHPRKLNYYLQEGLTLEQAIEKHEKKNKRISLREFCKVFGISDATVKSRLQRGISLLDAFTEPSNTNRGEINKEVIYVGSN